MTEFPDRLTHSYFVENVEREERNATSTDVKPRIFGKFSKAFEVFILFGLATSLMVHFAIIPFQIFKLKKIKRRMNIFWRLTFILKSLFQLKIKAVMRDRRGPQQSSFASGCCWSQLYVYGNIEYLTFDLRF